MRKLLTSLAVVTLLILCVTGCARKTNGQSEPKRFVILEGAEVFVKDSDENYGVLQMPRGFVIWAKVVRVPVEEDRQAPAYEPDLFAGRK